MTSRPVPNLPELSLTTPAHLKGPAMAHESDSQILCGLVVDQLDELDKTDADQQADQDD